MVDATQVNALAGVESFARVAVWRKQAGTVGKCEVQVVVDDMIRAIPSRLTRW